MKDEVIKNGIAQDSFEKEDCNPDYQKWVLERQYKSLSDKLTSHPVYACNRELLPCGATKCNPACLGTKDIYRAERFCESDRDYYIKRLIFVDNNGIKYFKKIHMLKDSAGNIQKVEEIND